MAEIQKPLLTGSASPKRVSRACQRCRRQKLKCDIQRPCTLCVRAGAACVSSGDGNWKRYVPPGNERPMKRVRLEVPGGSSVVEDSALSLGSRAGGFVDLEDSTSTSNERPKLGESGGRNGSHDNDDGDGNKNDDELNDDPSTTGNSSQRLGHSSSTMSLVDGVFRLYKETTPEVLATDAIPGGQRSHDVAGNSANDSTARALLRMRRPLASTSTMAELTSLFPNYEAASLLVDTYFDRVHWFMLLFHQDEFRQRWQLLYRQLRNNQHSTAENLGFISTFLMVIAIGLQYAGAHRKHLLATYQVDCDALQTRIFAAIRERLLDIMALGILEAAQTCVLLGTYYLFHGNPGLAWPVCGCALRIAQALYLHRKQQPPSTDSERPSMTRRNENEARKRCWWAIYEIETFCSMSYGYPHSINDTDCDVEPLDPSAKLPAAQSPASFNEPLQCETTLLTYKYLMSKLSVITNEILSRLYCVGSASANNLAVKPKLSSQHLVRKVASINRKLEAWKAEIPPLLQAHWTSSSDTPGYASREEFDLDIGASGPVFESHIFQLQALTLQLAYENARIIVNRPLLSFRLVTRSNTVTNQPHPDPNDPFTQSMQACRDAAINITKASSIPIMNLVADTYAAAFVGIHTFTAGLTLGILNSIDPLSSQSHEAKVGLQRLMVIQAKLKERSPLPAQGLEILQRLARHVLEKELRAMLAMPGVESVRASGGQEGRHEHRRATAEEYPCQQQPDSLPSTNTYLPVIAGLEETSPSGTNDTAFQYIPDTALSQAVAEFEKAMLPSSPFHTSQAEQGSDNLTWPFADDVFPSLEQAWIWGLDSFTLPE